MGEAEERRRGVRSGWARSVRWFSGFTLIELLVVIAIIALLLSILVPALAAARKRGREIKCGANMRELIMACRLYTTEEKDVLPLPNWDDAAPGARLGWLYCRPLPPWSQLKPEFRQTGLFWRTLGYEAIYRCPDHRPPYYHTAQMTSYLMNGAVVGYGRQLSGWWDYSTGRAKTGRKLNCAFQWGLFRANDAIFWEADDTRGGTGWNDGSSYPDEGLKSWHGNGMSIACIDGHVEWLTREIVVRESSNALPLQRSRLWCAPDRPDGH